MYIKRTLQATLVKMKKSVLLLGPRQTGKSTLIKKLSPEVIINLADEALFLRISSDPDYFFSVIKNKKTVFVDEIQRIPSLLNSIQKLIDDEKIKFFLSGSSARKLKRGEANLLPGRIVKYEISGLSLKELEYPENLTKALSYGFLPEPYLEEGHKLCKKLLSTYAQVYLKEEIQSEALTRNLPGFIRFLNMMAQNSGRILDFSKISTKSKVSRTSIIRFIEILEDTLIGYRVESFLEAEDADVIKHPKFYFFDPGVLNGLLNNFNVSEDRMGNLFEHLVYAQLVNSAKASDLNLEIFYFRTRNDVEVDFIIKLNDNYYAVEVKSGEVTKDDIKSLKKFEAYFPAVKQSYVVSLKEKQKRSLDNITVCSLSDLLKDLGL